MRGSRQPGDLEVREDDHPHVSNVIMFAGRAPRSATSPMPRIWRCWTTTGADWAADPADRRRQVAMTDANVHKFEPKGSDRYFRR